MARKTFPPPRSWITATVLVVTLVVVPVGVLHPRALQRPEVPSGLDLYMPVPDDNPLTLEKVTLLDQGRYMVTGVEEDRGAFKSPTLRNVARTAPYMHDGSIATLEEVIDYYDRGGNKNIHVDPELHPLKLAAEEKQALVAFLRSLSGIIQEGLPRRPSSPSRLNRFLTETCLSAHGDLIQ